MQRSKSLALGFLIGTLVAGGALGFTADRLMTRNASRSPTERAAMRQYLADRLELTPAQRARVDSILDNRHREMSRVVAPVKPRLDSVRDQARSQILSVLSPSQQAEFRRIIEESRAQEESDKK
jgi:Spy/CpxP family protein refolding chaperone